MYPHGPTPWDSADPPTPPHGMPRMALDDYEQTRLAQAIADLDEARRADLTLLPDASLIRLVERLRGSLDDMVQLLQDLQR